MNSWTDTRWELRTMSDSISTLMVPDGPGKNLFRLRAVEDNKGAVVCYKVDFEPDAMHACWQPCSLIPRGDQDAKAPAWVMSLRAEPTEDALDAAVEATLGEVNQAKYRTERLECDIVVPENAARSQPAMLGSLILYQVPRALGDKQALLLVSFNTDASPGGTGGGGSVDKP